MPSLPSPPTTSPLIISLITLFERSVFSHQGDKSASEQHESNYDDYNEL